MSTLYHIASHINLSFALSIQQMIRIQGCSFSSNANTNNNFQELNLAWVISSQRNALVLEITLHKWSNVSQFNLCIVTTALVEIFQFQSLEMSAIFRRGRAPQGKIHSVTASSHRLNTFNITMSNFDIKNQGLSSLLSVKKMFLFSHFVQASSPIKQAIYREEGLIIERLGSMALLLIRWIFHPAVHLSCTLALPTSFCQEWRHLECQGNYVLKSFQVTNLSPPA